jgi:hypothetical protein
MKYVGSVTSVVEEWLTRLELFSAVRSAFFEDFVFKGRTVIVDVSSLAQATGFSGGTDSGTLAILTDYGLRLANQSTCRIGNQVGPPCCRRVSPYSCCWNRSADAIILQALVTRVEHDACSGLWLF